MSGKPPIVTLAGLAVLVSAACWGQSAVTIYNQGFAVVRDRIGLELQIGPLQFRTPDLHIDTAHQNLIAKEIVRSTESGNAQKGPTKSR